MLPFYISRVNRHDGGTHCLLIKGYHLITRSYRVTSIIAVYYCVLHYDYFGVHR